MAVRGVSVDDNTIRSVLVNGRPARSVAGNFLEWEAEVEVKGASGPMTVAALAEDAAGNTEPVPHRVAVALP